MVEFAHEVIFKDEDGRKCYLRKMADKRGEPSYFLKGGKNRKLVRFQGNLPLKIGKVLEENGFGLSSRNEPLSVDVEGKSYVYFPLIELPEGKKATGIDVDGKAFVKISVDSDFADWLDNKIVSTDIHAGVHAFFDEYMGGGAKYIKKDILTKNRTTISRAILLALHRMRTGADKDSTYYMESIGRVSPDVESAVKKRLKALDEDGIRKLADIVNHDEKMAILRRKHKIPEFAVDELLGMRNKLVGGSNE